MANIIFLSSNETCLKVLVGSNWSFLNINNCAKHEIDVESPSYVVNHLLVIKFDRHIDPYCQTILSLPLSLVPPLRVVMVIQRTKLFLPLWTLLGILRCTCLFYNTLVSWRLLHQYCTWPLPPPVFSNYHDYGLLFW